MKCIEKKTYYLSEKDLLKILKIKGKISLVFDWKDSNPKDERIEIEVEVEKIKRGGKE